MLQQTQVKTVIPYWERWMEALPRLEDLAGANSGEIHKLWEGLGYYTRVRNMQRAARDIVNHYEGKFPTGFDQILKLPGIGRYTAGAICSIAYNQPVPVLDGNVIRVLSRVFAVEGDPRERHVNDRLWRLAEVLVNQANLGPSRRSKRSCSRRKPGNRSCAQLNQSLMELGALICTARQPRCADCPIARFCVALRDNRVSNFPALKPRRPAIARRFAAFVVQRHDRFLVRQRGDGVVNAFLWEFPNVEIITQVNNGTDASIARLGAAAREALGVPGGKLEHLCTVTHSITRYRISLDVYRAQLDQGALPTMGRWFKLTKLASLPFCSAHKRIIEHISAPGSSRR
jgi:A/G-specific adenine glycosylase